MDEHREEGVAFDRFVEESLEESVRLHEEEIGECTREWNMDGLP